jgi:hypothetical protein
MLTSRLPEDQPTDCTCFARPASPPYHAVWCAARTIDLVPGYGDSRDGQADARDQRKADQR